MSLTFQKPPLVELIAELRWGAISVVGAGQTPVGAIQIGFADAADEQFYMKFAAEIHQYDFRIAERLFPPGFPMPIGQAVWRFRNEKSASHILQIGPGTFTANAVRPYSSWEVFRPNVKSGVAALLRSRPDKDKNTPFASVSLRYLDLFSTELTNGRPETVFIRDVLGFDVRLPKAVQKCLGGNDAAETSVAVRGLIDENLNLRVSLAPGNVGGEVGILMDTNVFSTVPTAAAETDLMDIFEKAHEVIHNLFVQMTQPIHKLMEPRGAD